MELAIMSDKGEDPLIDKLLRKMGEPSTHVSIATLIVAVKSSGLEGFWFYVVCLFGIMGIYLNEAPSVTKIHINGNEH